MKLTRKPFERGQSTRGTKTAFFVALGVSTALAVTTHPSDSATAAPAPATRAAAQAYTPAPVPVSPQEATAQRILEARIASIGREFNGDVGIAVKDIQTGYVTHYDGASHFPQQSVSKFWVSLTALDKQDRGELDLSAPVTVRKSDLTLFNQPIAGRIGANGYDTTLANLLQTAMQKSDNTANDFVLRRAGGPDAVRAFLARKGIDGIRFGPGERLMQSAIAGISWNPAFSTGNGFYAARSAVPQDVRRAAFNRYVSDPVDGATPVGVVNALARLKKGELLSPASTARILSIMSNTTTGPQRLKGGLAPGWSLAHKTGTGQVLGPVQSGYNDIGIVTSPDGKSYSVAVMIRQTSAPIIQRMQMMQSVTRAVIDYDRNVGGYGVAAAAGGYTGTRK